MTLNLYDVEYYDNDGSLRFCNVVGSSYDEAYDKADHLLNNMDCILRKVEISEDSNREKRLLKQRGKENAT